MLAVFQVCFLAGMGLIVLSFIIGNLFDFLGIDGLDLDLDFFGLDFSLPLNPILYILLATVFGGTGWIMMKAAPSLPAVLIAVLAAAAGVAAAVFLQLAIIRPLKKAENTSSPDQEELIGVLAEITEAIPEKGFGEISYVIKGNSFKAPAKSTTGEAIKKGYKVTICWVEEHIFYVAAIEL